ncbi:MAG: SLBB domain-containing protein [Treponema sp.]|jgi:electron transport complex protein RnfC|nr:SLBB domain-containing protein [Treponema sp.]
MKVYSFPRGGLRYEDPSIAFNASSAGAFLPALSVIPLIQHAGSRAYPIVGVGDWVKEGMLIGRGQGLGSANIHATVPGKVVRMVSWKMAEGITNDALVIRMEGSFEKLGKREEVFPWDGLSPFELQRIITEYGIVEMEGAGQPVSDMLSAFRSLSDPLTLVVRCVFDDPWLAADYTLCCERLEAVAEGSAIAARAARMSRIVFAVSYRERELGERLMNAAGAWGLPASAVFTGSRYPQRNRRELELVLRLYEKKEGAELGSLLILGPAALAAIHDAVKLHKPILDRYVAVGGTAVKHPQVMKARLGTRIRELFEECGGFADRPARIASGSPLRGRAVADLDEPVMKTTSGVFALREAGVGKGTVRDCIGCGECRAVCPVGLDPEDLYKRVSARGKDGESQAALPETGCHGCGCCEAVCPSHLPLSVSIASAGEDHR